MKLMALAGKLRPLAVKLAYSPLPGVLLAASIVITEFQVNIDTTYPQALIVPLIEAVLIGTLPFLLYRKVLHSRLATTVAAFLAVPMLYEFEPRVAPLGPLFHNLFIDLFAVIVALVLCGLAGWAAQWLAPRIRLQPAKVVQFGIIAVVVMFSYSAVSVTIQLIALHPQTQELPSPIAALTTPQAATKPDIYYLVLEDYANNDTLKKIYHYDNSPFLDYLTSQGFTVRGDAHSNYPYTQNSVPSSLKMDYLTAEAAQFKTATPTELPMRAIFDNPPVVQALKKQGYQYLQVGSWWSDTRDIPAADTNYTKLFQLNVLGRHTTLSEFDYNVVAKSVFGRFLKVGLRIGSFNILTLGDYDIASLTQYQLSSLKDIAQSSPQGGRFIFGHILSPHPPFAYDADGSTPEYSQQLDDVGATIEQKYVNQLRYINDQTRSLIDTIKRSAKVPPVIIIQSDEGPHPRELGISEPDDFDLTQLSDAKLQQKYGILAAYDLPGATPEEIARLDSPVNTFRVMLNHYFGYTLDNLPDCSYAMAQVKPFDFTDITARLKGTADPRCAQIHAR